MKTTVHFMRGWQNCRFPASNCDKVFLQHFHGFKGIFGTAESTLAITSGTSTTLPSRYWLGINDPCARYAQQWKCYQVVFLLNTVVFLAGFISPPSRTSLILFYSILLYHLLVTYLSPFSDCNTVLAECFSLQGNNEMPWMPVPTSPAQSRRSWKPLARSVPASC